MIEQEYVFVSEERKNAKESGNLYHKVKLADPATFENHTVYVDTTVVLSNFNIPSGTKVKVFGKLQTPYNRTSFVVTDVVAVS